MKKKILSILITVLSLCTCMFTLTSCGENEPPHTHTYSVLKYDTENHWHECSCGEKKDIENHKGGTATEINKATCSVCNQEYGESLGHVHTLHLTKVDAKPQSCTEEGNREYYTCSCDKWFTDNTATTEITDKTSVVIAKDDHNYTELKKSETQHWYECTCGEKTTPENHKGGTATCTEKAKCSVCSTEYGEIEEHDYVNYICTECKTEQFTKDLTFRLVNNEYIITGIKKSCKDEFIIIPEYYLGLPVVEIERMAFYNNETIKKIKISSNIKDVGTTFDDLPNLTEILFSKECKIEKLSVHHCKIKELYVPESVVKLSVGNCQELKNIVFSDADGLIELTAWSTAITELKIPNGVKILGSLQGNKNLSKIEIPNSISTIEDNCFSGCSKIEIVDFIGDVDEWAQIDFQNSDYLSLENPIEYGGDLFINGVLLTYAYFDTALHISRSAFRNCQSLREVYIGNTVVTIEDQAFYSCEALEKVHIGDGVKFILADAFSICENMQEVYIGQSVCHIGTVFSSEKLKKFTYNAEEVFTVSPHYSDRILQHVGDETVLIIGPKVKHIPDYLFRGGHFKEIIFDDNSIVESIGDYAFGGATTSLISKVALPKTLKYLGDGAFEECMFNDFILHNGIEYFGRDSMPYFIDNETCYEGGRYIGNENNPYLCLYASNYSLTKIQVHSSCKYICCIFDGDRLEEISLPSGLLYVTSGSFNECEKLEYTNEGGLLYLGNSSNPYLYLADTQSKDITSATINNRCVIIGDEAFANSKITEITIPYNVRCINSKAFYNCQELTRVYNNVFNYDNTIVYGESAFEGCVNLESVIIETKTCHIKESAFEGCSKLETLYLITEASYIGSFAFCGCEKLERLDSYCFTGVKSIDNAFGGCSSLEYIYLGESIQKIGSGAFYGVLWNCEIIVGSTLKFVGYDVLGDEKTAERFLPGENWFVVGYNGYNYKVYTIEESKNIYLVSEYWYKK